MSNYKEKLVTINTLAFDYDGVFTDGIVYLSDQGDQYRGANAKDGYALQLAARNGYRICVISGAMSESILKRLNNLGIHDVFIGAYHKLEVFTNYCTENGITKQEILYMGDDIPDLPVMKNAGVTCCPSDAVWEVKAEVDYISHYQGGKGCVRDVIEQVMRLQNKWMQDDAFIW